MRIVNDAKAVRIDVHPATITNPECPKGSVVFKLESGEQFTMSPRAIHQLMEMAAHWGGALVEVSARDSRLIGKGVCDFEDYPR